MSQWQNLLLLDAALQGRVIRLYEGKFHRDIRHHLSVWIESQDWDSAATDEHTARICFHALLVYLEEQWNRSVQENTILQGPDFSRMKDYLMEHFQNEPLKLAMLLSHLLSEERTILASASKPQVCSSPGPDFNRQLLDNQINKLKTETLELKKEIKALQDLNEKLDFVQKTWQSQVEQHIRPAQSYTVVEEKCLKRANFITETKQIILNQIVTILKQTEQVVTTVIDEELVQWRHRQQLACIGSPADSSLAHLQKWFTCVAEVLLGLREQLQRLEEQSQKYNNTDASTIPETMANIRSFVSYLLTKLLTKALVVEKQPVMQSQLQRPLILKTNVRFKVTLRFLVNRQEFKELKIKLVFDKDVEEVETVHGFRRFEFYSGDSTMLDVDTGSGALMAEFENLSIKEKRCRVKGSSENHLVVTEELHIIKFLTTVQFAGVTFDIETSSLPVVVVSSCNQIPSAWASIMWWNMHSSGEPWNLSLFAKPPPLSWERLSQTLSWQFLSVGQRELDENQLATLRVKIVDDADGLVHWNTFSKNNNAWDWIDGILDLIKKHLLDLWRDGFIMGFVSKERTRSLLLKKVPGTFLLRFSESNKDGAITFSWVDHSSGEKRVHAVEPYTKKELQALSLPDIIYHYSLMAQKKARNPLLYLYPDISKDTAFGRYYKATERAAPPNIDGYVHRKLVCISVNPSPPPSPSAELTMMDTDQDMDACVVEELLSSLTDSPGSSQLFHLEAPCLHPPSPLFSFDDAGRSF